MCQSVVICLRSSQVNVVVSLQNSDLYIELCPYLIEIKSYKVYLKHFFVAESGSDLLKLFTGQNVAMTLQNNQKNMLTMHNLCKLNIMECITQLPFRPVPLCAEGSKVGTSDSRYE